MSGINFDYRRERIEKLAHTLKAALLSVQRARVAGDLLRLYWHTRVDNIQFEYRQRMEDSRAQQTAELDDATLSFVVAYEHDFVSPSLTPYGRSALSKFQIGDRLEGRYLLERELGRGGMGQVYLGRDLRLERLVAIKVIAPLHVSNHEKQQVDELTKEAQLGARLVHPAIATVYDLGLHSGSPFAVIEYLGGPTLQEELRRRKRFSLDDTRLIISPLAQALDYAHSRRIVHRDLKPANIKSSSGDHFKILDLGLAREFHQENDWRFAGTPAYSSPEQVAQQACDGRADQYALGCVVYEMITGRRVFEANDVKGLLHLHQHERPELASKFVTDLPAGVAAAIARALEKDPAARFPNCCAFATAIGCQFLSDIVSAPEILVENEVRRASTGWTWGKNVSGWRKHAHLVLTPTHIWIAYDHAIYRAPIAGATVTVNHARGLVVCHPQIPLFRFRFANQTERDSWCQSARKTSHSSARENQPA